MSMFISIKLVCSFALIEILTAVLGTESEGNSHFCVAQFLLQVPGWLFMNVTRN